MPGSTARPRIPQVMARLAQPTELTSASSLALRGRDQRSPAAWLCAHIRGRGCLMRAYVGWIALDGLRQFLAEDAVPSGLLRDLVQEWSSPTTTVVWAVVSEDDAEAIRHALAAEGRWAACNLLLNRAVEIHPVVVDSPD